MNFFNPETIKKSVFDNFEVKPNEKVEYVTELFPDGIEITLGFIKRDGKIYFLEEIKKYQKIIRS